MSEVAETTGFEARSRKVAEHFIQSVVILDDLAEFGHATTEAVEELDVPTLDNTSENHLTDGQPDESTAKELASRGFPLDAKAVMDRFAEFGSVCAVLKPVGNEEFHQRVTKVASRADIVLLDWKIGVSYGEDTLNLIRSILKDDSYSQRLRLLAIYTGEGGLHDITNRVGSVIDEFYDGEQFIQYDDFRISKGPVRVVVLAKEGTVDSYIPGVADQVISENGLADRLVKEFSMMTRGLLRNVALEGLAALRDHVHKLLSKFDRTLDPAYLGHRLLLPHPPDSEAHAVEVLGAELLSILEDRKPGNEANLEAIREWLIAAKDAGLNLSVPIDVPGKTDPLEKWVELLTYGKDGVSSLPTTKSNLEHSATEIFAENSAAGILSNRLFSALLSLKTRYSASTPQLTLGTILCQECDNRHQYFLCLQPKCDSVRLENPTGFPLLPLVVRDKNDNNQKFNLVITPEDGEWEYLEYTSKPSELTVRTFSPGKMPPGEIEGSKESDGFYFQDTDGAKYKWIAEMKDDHALKVVGDLASALARPGPNDAEWLRLASLRRK